MIKFSKELVILPLLLKLEQDNSYETRTEAMVQLKDFLPCGHGREQHPWQEGRVLMEDTSHKVGDKALLILLRLAHNYFHACG